MLKPDHVVAGSRFRVARLGMAAVGLMMAWAAGPAVAAWPVLPEVNLANYRVSDFADDELDVPYMLKHFARVAGSVVETGPNKGFLNIAVTVAGNLTLPLMLIKGLSAADSEPLIRKALQDVGLDPDTVLTLDREQLSGGMAKRIAIARALVMQPLLIFFDEPTTGLDPKSDELIQDLIFKTYCESPESSPATGANPPQPAVIPGPNTPAIAGNRTVLIVTHDRDLLRRLQPRIIMLDSGRICFDGSYDAFATAQSPIIRPYFEYMPALQHSRMPSLP